MRTYFMVLPKKTLPSLKERSLLTVPEFKRIKKDNFNPNNKYIRLSFDHNYRTEILITANINYLSYCKA
jgi:hypothetical protein